MARRFARQRFSRPAPRTKMWIGATLGDTALAASTATLMGTLNAAALLLRPFTILRTHLDCRFSSDQLISNETPFGDLGMMIVSDKAAALGITAVPAPISQIDSDWFVHQGMSDKFIFGSTAAFVSGGGQHYNIDSKAMRKVGPDQDVVFVFEVNSAVGAELIIFGRQLIQLH